MIQNRAYTTIIFVICLFYTLSPQSLLAQVITQQTSATVTRDDLEKQIKDHTEKLRAVNQQIESTKAALQTTQEQKTTLQKQIKTIDYSISQLGLNIQADQLASQRATLEINSLNYDIKDITTSMDDKKEVVMRFLRELHQNDVENVLFLFLRNGSLAEGVNDARSLDNMRAQLVVDLQDLKNLQGQYQGKLGDVNQQKIELDFHQQNLKNRKVIVEEQKEERKNILAQTKNQESAYQKQLDELKKQQNAIEDEIQKIEDQLRAAFDVTLLPTARSGVFSWPITNGTPRITQHYGERSYLYRGKPHNGLDIGTPVGTPVLAADNGIVIGVDNNDKSRWSKYQYGKYVLIKHDNNLATIYAHLSQQVVTEGQIVKRGEIVGYSGSTGYATGPHLHFGAYWAPSIIKKSIPPAAGLVPIGVTLNPENYL